MLKACSPHILSEVYISSSIPSQNTHRRFSDSARLFSAISGTVIKTITNTEFTVGFIIQVYGRLCSDGTLTFQKPFAYLNYFYDCYPPADD